jgi:hypothetical protein
MMGAFQDMALGLHARGAAVIPTGGEDGKTPLVNGWSKWKGQSRQTVEAFSRKHPEANIGIVTGLSRLTVVDADDEKTLADAEVRFGKSPLITRSPRGGGHIYFKSSGERNANLRPEMNADIRGVGGMVLVPPSVRAGVGCYRIERGSWDDLQRLPTVDVPLALPEKPKARPAKPEAIEGARNNSLFLALRYHADACDSVEALFLEAHAINAQFPSPLPKAEAEKVARSVWRMKQEGRLILPGKPRILMTFGELEMVGADACYLYLWLKRWHGAKNGASFALSAKAMEKAKVLPGWGRRRYELATIELRAVGLIERIHKGGAKRGDPSIFRMGRRNSPNVTKHPSAASPLVLGSGKEVH